MTFSLFDPLPESPYYLRILNPQIHRDEIRQTRIANLKDLRLWDEGNSGIRQLAEPLQGALYTQLIHREYGTAGMLECISFSELAAHYPQYPNLGYYHSFIERDLPEVKHYLRTVYLNEPFRHARRAILYLALLNNLYLNESGIRSAVFCHNIRSGPRLKLFAKLGSRDISSLNSLLSIQGVACCDHFSWIDGREMIDRITQYHFQPQANQPYPLLVQAW